MANLSDEPVDDVSLSLAFGPLCGTLIAQPLLGPDDTTASLRPPVVSATGGFDGWAIGPLGSRESLVIALGRPFPRARAAVPSRNGFRTTEHGRLPGSRILAIWSALHEAFIAGPFLGGTAPAAGGNGRRR